MSRRTDTQTEGRGNENNFPNKIFISLHWMKETVYFAICQIFYQGIRVPSCWEVSSHITWVSLFMSPTFKVISKSCFNFALIFVYLLFIHSFYQAILYMLLHQLIQCHMVIWSHSRGLPVLKGLHSTNIRLNVTWIWGYHFQSLSLKQRNIFLQYVKSFLRASVSSHITFAWDP